MPLGASAMRGMDWLPRLMAAGFADRPKAAMLLLRLALGVTLLLAPGNRSAEHLLLHEVAEDTWVPLGLLGGVETAFRLVDLLEYGLGLLLLTGCFTRWAALAAAALFAAFIAGIGLVELNRDVGLLAGSLALALLDDGGWSVDRLLQHRWSFPARAGAWLEARLARFPPNTAGLLLRGGLAFTLIATGVLLFRGVASFGSPIFLNPEPAPLIATAELALGLWLISGWRIRAAGVVVCGYFVLTQLQFGFETQMRSLILAGCGGALGCLGSPALAWDDLRGIWSDGWSLAPAATRAGAAGLAALLLLALAPALAWGAGAEDHHEIYFELYTDEIGPFTYDADEGQTASGVETLSVLNLTYLSFSLAVQDSDGDPDQVSIDVSSPGGVSLSGATSEQLVLLFQLGDLPPEGNLPEAAGALYQHTNGTGPWNLAMECEEAPGTVVLGQDLGDDGVCDWTVGLIYQFFESHIVEHGH